MKYIVTLNGTDYEVEVDELKEAIVTNVAPAKFHAQQNRYHGPSDP